MNERQRATLAWHPIRIDESGKHVLVEVDDDMGPHDEAWTPEMLDAHLDALRSERDAAIARAERAEAVHNRLTQRVTAAERSEEMQSLAGRLADIESERDEALAKLKAAAPHVAELREWCAIDGQIGLGAYLEDLCELLEVIDPEPGDA